MTSFDLDTFLSLPRLAGLALSRDGSRLVTGAATPGPDGKRFRSSLWSIDPGGTAEAAQLTRSRKGEGAPRFAPDGRLLFTSPRPDPDGEGDDTDTAALWQLPEHGEARLVFDPKAGVTAVRVAADSGDVLVATELFPDADDLEADAARHDAREEAGVTAQLYEDYPVRHWDRWLGPREPALWLLTDGEEPELVARGRGFHESDPDLSPDGTMVVAAVRRMSEPDPRARATDLVIVDVASRERRDLLADGGWYGAPRFSPDGRRIAAVRMDPGAPDRPVEATLVVVDVADGTHRTVAPGLDVWPGGVIWLAGSGALVVDVDEAGHHPLYRIDLGPSGAEDRVTRLTADGAYGEVCPAPDGETLYALRSTVGRPHHPVRLSASDPDQAGEELPSPATGIEAPGTIVRLDATASDGAPVPSWLVLPEGASPDAPAPLVVFIHGGPLGSWNGWHWRWSPHVLAEHGYAVLLPDPALSTGYGPDVLARGWGTWGTTPYTDVMAAVDAAVAREEVDADRTAAMGGSFGGYLANWVAGQTDRFRAIVTHASLWALRGFHGTTDLGAFWEHQFGDPYLDPSRYVDHSPDRAVADISTPMLVIHGERDYRVPISEALQLWTDLSLHQVPAKFLYFPDENHWVLKPQNARLWYRTVLAFLDHHVLGRPWERPELL